MIDKLSNKESLMKAYNALKKESLTNSHVEIGRLNRALGIAMRKEKYDRYGTTWTGCLCPDDQHRSQFICKHRLALMLENAEDLFLMLFEGTPIQ